MTQTETATGVTPEARVRAIVDEVIAGTTYFVVDVVVRGRTGSRVVEVFLDGDEGVGVDELARVSREVGFLLETEEVIRGRYNLNVSSPGAQRPLVSPRQYPRHVGRPFEARFAASPEAPPTTVVGTLIGVDEAGFDVKDARGTVVHVGFDAVQDARVRMPW